MSVVAPAPRTASAAAPPPASTGVRAARGAGLLVALGALVLAAALSISVGARPIPLDQVWRLVLWPDGSDAAVIVQDLRIPRTLLGIVVGVALGLAGALMQALTRNPLAEPGLLGVNAGAAAAVVTGIAVFGTMGFGGYVWFAFLGAGLASVLVYGIGATGRAGASPVRLALAGTAITAALYAYVQAISLLRPRVFDQYRFWQVGSFAGHDASLVWQVGIPIAVGAILALSLAWSLNALALGEDTGRALGARVGMTRLGTAVAVTLLCGAATAATGPITFLGLAVPHLARAITGPDQRWVLPYSLVLAPTLLLVFDVIGRWLGSPGEVQVGIVTAVLGGPVFIALVRRRRIAQL